MTEKCLIIAHRGGAGLWPENTLAAFSRAIAHGFDGAELDVQLSADGVAVVHHDYRLNPGYCRGADGRWLSGETPRIKDLSLAELQRYDLGRAAPGSAYDLAHPALASIEGACVPALVDVAAAARAASFTLLVELKSSADPDSADPLALADAALAVMRDQLAQTVFVGFDWRGLTRIKEKAPGARCWFTTDRLTSDATPVLDSIVAAGGDGWFPTYEDITAESVAQTRARGLKIAAWTVNDPVQMQRLIALGLDAECTDRPDILQALE